MWPQGLSLGQQSLCLKFYHISRFEQATKSRKGWLLPLLRETKFVALIERDNIGGLAKEIDLLKDWRALAFYKISRQAWQTAIKPINNHRGEIRESVLQIFDTPRKQRTWLLILWSRKCWTQIVAADCRGLGVAFCWSRLFRKNLIFEYFADLQFFWMSFDSSNDIIHLFDSFCRGVPIIPLPSLSCFAS